MARAHSGRFEHLPSHGHGAGALARWFKMMMAEVVKNRIFLDSDDVNKLDAIMDVTAHDAEPWNNRSLLPRKHRKCQGSGDPKNI